MKLLKKSLCIIVSIALLICTQPINIVALADECDYYVQYTGTTRSNGYNVECTFTVNENKPTSYCNSKTDNVTGSFAVILHNDNLKLKNKVGKYWKHIGFILMTTPT